PVGRDQVGDAVGAVRLADRVEGVEFDARAERIADGSAEQTATYPAAEVLLFGAAPDSGVTRRGIHTGTSLGPASPPRGAHPSMARLRSLTARPPETRTVPGPCRLPGAAL